MPHEHKWVPLIQAELINGIPQVRYGSLGSQIGFSCECGAQQILWPNSAYIAGISEETLINLNKSFRKR
jgi:hypothetical protein